MSAHVVVDQQLAVARPSLGRVRGLPEEGVRALVAAEEPGTAELSVEGCARGFIVEVLRLDEAGAAGA